MPKSLNRVQLIGNLTRDPELRYTPTGAAVCSFGIATNRGWTTDSGEKKEETEFHNIVSWNKLAELCSQFLVKGRKVYVEGRLQTRNWEDADKNKHYRTEIVIDDMILLDSQRREAGSEEVSRVPSVRQAQDKQVSKGEGEEAPVQKPAPKKAKEEPKEEADETITPDDIPF